MKNSAVSHWSISGSRAAPSSGRSPAQRRVTTNSAQANRAFSAADTARQASRGRRRGAPKRLPRGCVDAVAAAWSSSSQPRAASGNQTRGRMRRGSWGSGGGAGPSVGAGGRHAGSKSSGGSGRNTDRLTVSLFWLSTSFFEGARAARKARTSLTSASALGSATSRTASSSTRAESLGFIFMNDDMSQVPWRLASLSMRARSRLSRSMFADENMYSACRQTCSRRTPVGVDLRTSSRPYFVAILKLGRAVGA